MTPFRAADRFDWPALRALIARACAGMKARIAPPSALHRLTAATLARQARTAEIRVIGQPPLACMVLTPRPDALDLGKRAVEPDRHGRGLGRALVTVAEDRARALRFSALELETRVKLHENQRWFAGLGFQEVARKAHPGFDRPTTITCRVAV